MNNLKSEVLLNRALLWTVLAGIDHLAGASRWAVVLQIACALVNVWRSYRVWEG